MSWEDPIVKEVRDVRAEIAAEQGNDVRALCAHLQQREQKENREIVTRPPRRSEIKKTAAG